MRILCPVSFLSLEVCGLAPQEDVIFVIGSVH